jgi:chorismate synthase
VSLADINRDLWRRQQGYGRGGRMKIEADEAQIVAGVRHSHTIGAPVAILVRNRDWDNWAEVLSVEGPEVSKGRAVTRPRPGHADLAGALKYGFRDARYILERASARETAARVALGGLAKEFLGALDVQVLSHVVAVGSARLARAVAWDEIAELSTRPEVVLGCVDAEAEAAMKAVVDEAISNGDSVGGVFEVVAHNVPPGLGSHVSWDSRLDGRLAQAVVSIQAVKGVEVGSASEGAASFGSTVQDTIHYDAGSRRFTRGSNRAGGIEGGITNGQDVVVRGMLKPISTLRTPLESADLVTHEPSLAAYERSDVCAVPAAGVVGEAMVALVLAQAMLEKFGGDSLGETRRNYEGYLQQVREY